MEKRKKKRLKIKMFLITRVVMSVLHNDVEHPTNTESFQLDKQVKVTISDQQLFLFVLL